MKKSLGWLLAACLLACMGAPAFAQTTVTAAQSTAPDHYRTAFWEALAKNYVGSAVDAGAWGGLKTVAITVTAAGEQNLTIQGSMDGSIWFTLSGAALSGGAYTPLTSLTASGMYLIIEEPRFIRPLISNEAGATGVDIDVTLGGACLANITICQ